MNDMHSELHIFSNSKVSDSLVDTRGKEKIHAQLVRGHFIAVPSPKPCVFSWLYFLYVVGVISFTCWPGCCSWTVHTSTAVWLSREFEGGQEEAGGSVFALSTTLIRGGIRKCHLGAAASCCSLPRGRKMWFYVTVFSSSRATFTWIAVVCSFGKRITSAAGWGLSVVTEL